MTRTGLGKVALGESSEIRSQQIGPGLHGPVALGGPAWRPSLEAGPGGPKIPKPRAVTNHCKTEAERKQTDSLSPIWAQGPIWAAERPPSHTKQALLCCAPGVHHTGLAHTRVPPKSDPPQ